MKDVKVSILFAYFNASCTIDRLISSLHALEYESLEIVAVDDGSTDDTTKKLLSSGLPRLKIISHANVGLTKSLNIGLAECRGVYVARIDADDWISPSRITSQVRLLDSNPDYSVCYGGCRFVDEDTQNVVSLAGYKDPYKLKVTNTIVHSTVMFRKSTILEFGGYNELFYTSQDYALWLSIYQRFGSGSFVYCDEICAVRYLSAEMISNKRWLQQCVNSFRIRSVNGVFIGLNLLATTYQLYCSIRRIF